MPRLRPPGPRAAGLAAAGAAYALVFAPDPLPAWALAPVHLLALAVLARLSLDARSVRQAAAGGWLFGWIACVIGVYWLYISMHTYGFMPAPLAAAGVLALAAYLALYFALAAGLARWVAHRRGALPAALAWAGAWTLAEWLRGVVFTGFPWLNAGYAHLDSPLAGWAPLGGVYAVAFVSAFCAAAIAFLWRENPRRAEPRQSIPAALAIVLALAGWALAQWQWWTPHGEPLQVRLVQGAVDQNDKFNPELLQAGLHRHLELAGTPTGPDAPAPELIVLPETIMPVFQDRLPPALWQAWRDLAGRQGSTILLGAPLRDREQGRVTNSVVPITAQTDLQALMAGRPAHRYDKRHLVPFGEFIPWGFRWFVQAMSIPLGDFDRGPARQTPFTLGGRQIAPNICFEDVFGEELRPALFPGKDGSPGANILVNFSNLGWFGDSWALRQHLQISRMRAIELARPMLRATNTGATAAIDADGQVLAQLPPMRPGVLGLAIQGTEGLTPYARAGNAPILLLAALLLAALALRRPRA
ncbi:apolipoprotein N-acyltransferase [Orrella sp. JC864]